MRSFLNVVRKIFLLAFLVFLVLCCHSCMMASSGAPETAPVGAAATPAAATPAPESNEITLSSGSFLKDTQNLVLHAEASDLPLLESFPNLASVDFTDSACTTEIASWAAAHPNVTVTYQVALPNGQSIPSTSQSVDLSGLTADQIASAAESLRLLPNVTSVELGVSPTGAGLTADELAVLQEARPNAVLHYALDLAGRQVSLSDTELDLTTLPKDQVQNAAAVMRSMSGLRVIHLGAEGGTFSWEDIAALHAAAPAAALDYTFNFMGANHNLADTELNLSHVKMTDQGAAVRAILPYMVNLQTLDMDSCDVSNENMAAIRAEYPNVNVIWRIWFAGYTVRTDVERILASSTSRGGQVTDSEAAKLMYCTKVKYLDLGHNEVLTDISFTRYMPDLEVLIVAINNISDISPLADCPKLEYLEINSTNVTDLTPLSNSMALRHLNIGRTVRSETNTGSDLDRPRVTDISPLFPLKDLERLWIGSLTAEGIPDEQIQKMVEIMGVTDFYNEDGTLNEFCERFNVTSGDPSQGVWRTTGERPLWVWEQWMQTGVFNDPLNERYALLREQFQYDLGAGAYSLAENDPLY